MGSAVRDIATFVLVAALLVACASTESPGPTEGQVVLQAGPPSGGSFKPAIVPGEDIRRLAILIPGADPAWRAGWVEGDTKQRGGGGAYSGLMTGLMIVHSVPFFVAFWPAAVGVVVGSTAMGAFGAQFDSTTSSRVTTEDRATILQAVADLRPDQLLRDSTIAALQARTGRKPFPLPWYPPVGPDTPGTDPLAEARAQGIDGVLNVSLEAFGLAMGEETETFGVFVRARAQLVDPAGGGIRYDRVLEHGPGRPLRGLPPPAVYSLEFLSVDQARVFRHDMQDVITRMAKVVAEDPSLPLAR
ncbi:MAG TPA: hypothetical protein VN648_35065 [Candidatus Methylomirabilis sp.]|nr:hypothetical protein [Candidatus Methylomirabilis sp.]